MLTGEIRFAQKVGVAPSTTTMELGASGALGIQCFPAPSIQERADWLGSLRTRTPAPAAPAAQPRRRREVYMDPYASEVEMRGLGVPSNSYSWMTGRPYSQPPGTPRGTTALVFSGPVVGMVDPNDAYPTGAVDRLREHGTIVMRVNPRRGGGFTEQLLGAGLGITSGEMARSLSGLGTVPNDDELARNLCYTPVHSGWIYGRTPTGEKYYVDGLYGASAALLSDDPAAISDILAIQRKQTLLQGITTLAIVSMAAASIWTCFTAAKGGIRKRVIKKRRRR